MRYNYFISKNKKKKTFNTYTNNPKYSNNKFIILNNRKYNNINNNYLQGGTYYKPDILSLGKISIERDINLLNSNYIQPDINGYLHIFDFISKHNIWVNNNDMSFINNDNILDKKSYFNNIINNNCDKIIENMDILYDNEIKLLLSDEIDIKSKKKIHNKLINNLILLSEIILFDNYNGNDDIIDLKMLDKEENTSDYLIRIKEELSKKKGGNYNNNNNILKKYYKYINNNTDTLFITNNKIYTNVKNNNNNIIINNKKLYLINNIQNGGGYITYDIIKYNYENTEGLSTIFTNTNNNFIKLTYIIGFCNLFRFSGLFKYPNSTFFILNDISHCLQTQSLEKIENRISKDKEFRNIFLYTIDISDENNLKLWEHDIYYLITKIYFDILDKLIKICKKISPKTTKTTKKTKTPKTPPALKIKKEKTKKTDIKKETVAKTKMNPLSNEFVAKTKMNPLSNEFVAKTKMNPLSNEFVAK